MTIRDLVLAVDVGSTWCKAAYLDPQGYPVAAGRAYTRTIPLDRHTTLAGFWDAFVGAVREATARLPSCVSPEAIAIATRAQFGVCLMATGEACLPAWDVTLDRKSSPDLQHAYSPAVWGEQDPHAYGYGMALAGLSVWLKHTRPDDWRNVWRIGALHDYIVFQLTSAWVTDPTTGPGQTEWPVEIVTMSGLPHSAFPVVLEPQQVAGQLTSAAGQSLGLPAGIPVVVGLHDGTAANYGVRALQAGDACLSLSTNFVLRTVNGLRLPPPATGYRVTLDRWAWVNNVPGASTQLDIVAQTLLPDSPSIAAAHAHLGRLADAVAPGADGFTLRLIPPGAEEELRQAVQQARQAGQTDGVIYRAILEAVALGVRDLIRRAESQGARPQRFVATGGSSQNVAFLRVLTAVLDKSIEIGPAEGGVLGTGMAAAVGAGWYATMEEAMRGMSAPGPMLHPDPAVVGYYCTNG